jgi:hypothetical protein
MRSMVEGPLPTPKNPSTALRAVPLPREAGGGIQDQPPVTRRIRRLARLFRLPFGGA